MEENMVEKYQQHYNQLVSSTLTDAIMKSISYQANIKLANEIIAEQEKKISEMKCDLESLKDQKEKTESTKIQNLENTLKLHNETINKLNSEIINSNKMKTELDNLRIQASNVDTFRKELIKERELHNETKTNHEKQVKELTDKIDLLKTNHEKQVKELTDKIDLLKTNHEKQVKELTDKIDLLENPPKKKKITKSLELPKYDDGEVTQETTKDGGIF